MLPTFFSAQAHAFYSWTETKTFVLNVPRVQVCQLCTLALEHAHQN